MTNKQKEIEKLLQGKRFVEFVAKNQLEYDDLSNKEKMFVLGVIEGLKLAKIAI